MKVLLFDPTPAYQLFLRDVASWLGHEPLCTESEADFFDLLQQEVPELVIIALEAGFEKTTGLFRQLEREEWAGAVLISADSGEPLSQFQETVPWIADHPNTAFILKPWTCAQVKSALGRTALSTKAARICCDDVIAQSASGE